MTPEHHELRDLNWSAQPSPCCHDNVFLSDFLWTYKDTRRSLFLKFFIWPINSGVLISLLLPYLSSFLTGSLPSLNLLCHSKTVMARKGSLMKTQTRILDNKLYYARKIELHWKVKKCRTVRITPIMIFLSGSEISQY